MLRKMIITMTLALVGLFAAAGVVSAAPVVYPPPEAVSLSGNSVAIDDVPIRLSGKGFAPNETVTLSLSGGGTLAVVQADANGNFAVDVTLTNPGVNIVLATGMTSHRTASFTVTVSAEGTTTSPGTTTVEVTDTAAVGTGSGTGSGAGLASTGANIAGPLTLGISALLAGVALLFFGTRLAIRRKQRPSAH